MKYLFQHGHIPKQFISWEPNIQTYEPMGIVLIQTNADSFEISFVFF